MELEQTVRRMNGGIADRKKAYAEGRVREILESRYDVGRVGGVTELFGGEVNRNYEAVTILAGEERRWFVRQYEPGRKIEEILYEYHLLIHLRERTFDQAPLPVAAKDGAECVRYPFGDEEHWFMVYEFLPGENTYQWERNNVSHKALESAVRLLARFHTAAADYRPEAGWKVREPVIREQLAGYGANIKRNYDHIKALGVREKDGSNDIFTRYLDSKEAFLSEALPGISKIFDHEDKLFKTVVHTDPHPGNFKYSDDKAVGLFDFDWVKEDVRLYDLAIGAMFFCSSWEGRNNGEADLSMLELFLRSYDNEIMKHKSGVPPVTDCEKEAFARMMAAGSLYVVNFSLNRCYNEEDMNLFLSFYYVQHQMSCAEWAIENEELIVDTVRKYKEGV